MKNYFPELLAKYCDCLLKTSSKNPEENEMEDAQNQLVSFKVTLCALQDFNVKVPGFQSTTLWFDKNIFYFRW